MDSRVGMETISDDELETDSGEFMELDEDCEGGVEGIPDCSVRIGGLPAPSQVSNSRLKALFEEYGVIREMVRKKETQGHSLNTTMAIITYESHAEAKSALDGLRKVEIVEGLRLSVRFWSRQNPASHSFPEPLTATTTHLRRRRATLRRR